MTQFAGGAVAYGYTQMGHIYEGEKIQPMIEMSNDGDTIIVHPGTYAENIDFMGKAITVRSENSYSEETVKSTILTKSYTAPIVKFRYGQNASKATLSGFTIEKGEAEYGAGIYIESCAPAISNCIIRNNAASSAGGGIYCATAASIRNCVIENNSARWSGGGIFFCGGEYAEISNCVFTNNTAQTSGAIHAASCARPKLKNCIVWNNSTPSVGGASDGYTIVYISYSCIQRDESAYSYRDPVIWIPGYTNLSTNESQFVDAANGNYHLKADSSCIDSGIYMESRRDMAGNFPQGTCDIGVFEFIP